MRALACSGGGDKGAFLTGVVKKLIEQGNDWDIFAGTSTGALIVPFLAIGDIETLENVYTNISQEDVLNTSNPLGRLLKKSSLYDISPLKGLVKKHLTEEVYNEIMNSGKYIFISTVCLNNMTLTYWTNSDMKGNSKYDVNKWKNRDQLIQCIISSCVQPVIMPIQDPWGMVYVDGGLKEFIPIEVAIDYRADDITAILTTTGKRYYDNDSFDNVADILLKTIEIFSSDVAGNDLRITQLYNDSIDYINECKESVQRNAGYSSEKIENLFTSAKNPFYDKRKLNLRVIRPAKELGNGLEFNTKEMNSMFEYGYNFIKENKNESILSSV